MLCKQPFVRGLQAHACGQCMPCRLNRRRLWTHRIMLEAAKHPRNLFVTLTYNDEHHPKGGSLQPRDSELWLKRFRFQLQPQHVRYYLVGEYGDQTWRPHYHAALFGVGIEVAELVNSTWGKGFTQCGPLTLQSAQYIAGYVTKKMNRKEDARLQGRAPEFCAHVIGTGDWLESDARCGERLEHIPGCEANSPSGGCTLCANEREEEVPARPLPH